MSVTSHNNIEKSLNKYVYDNLDVPFSYAVNYREVRFETNSHDLWLSIAIEEIGAGAKKPSVYRIDVVSRIVNTEFNEGEITAIDRIREVFTNASFSLYDFSSGVPVLVQDEKLIVKNNAGRFTVDRIVLNNLENEDLKQNLRRASVFFKLELLTDTVGGRVI